MAIDNTTLALLVAEAFGLHDVRPFEHGSAWFTGWVCGDTDDEGYPLLHVATCPSGTTVTRYDAGPGEPTRLEYRNINDEDGVRRVLRDAKAELVAAGCVFGGAK